MRGDGGDRQTGRQTGRQDQHEAAEDPHLAPPERDRAILISSRCTPERPAVTSARSLSSGRDVGSPSAGTTAPDRSRCRGVGWK